MLKSTPGEHLTILSSPSRRPLLSLSTNRCLSSCSAFSFGPPPASWTKSGIFESIFISLIVKLSRLVLTDFGRLVPEAPELLSDRESVARLFRRLDRALLLGTDFKDWLRIRASTGSKLRVEPTTRVQLNRDDFSLKV